MQRRYAVVLLLFFSVSAFAQWQPSGATSGPISYTGGNVGIGTTSPSAPLHVAGNAKVTGALRVGSHTLGSIWTDIGTDATGYLKLVTPIVHNEGNYFMLEITGYQNRYREAVSIRCSGNARALGTLTRPVCDVHGTALQVELTTEERPAGSPAVVVVRLGNVGSDNWDNSHWSVAYTGSLEKNAADFVWVKGEATPAQGPNMNNVVVDDVAGTLAIGVLNPTPGVRLTVNGPATFGNVGIGAAAHATYRLATVGAPDLNSFPNTPSVALIGSSRNFSVANNGAGIAFTARYDAAANTTTIGAISALKENTTDGNYAGALTFGTRAAGSGTGNMERMRIRSTGEVVIGQTGNTGTKLTVNGDVITNGSITGVRVFNAVYQDIAEWVPASEDMVPGTVVVLSPKNTNEVMPSGRAYDTSVAGVVSEQPGVLLGVGGASKEQIATTGRVRVRVDATAAPIAIGDLLVTSGTSGTAMKSIPVALGDTHIHRPGTIIGKALEPLASGAGEILVLLSLQ